MHEIIFVFQVVHSAACPDVALSVTVYFIIFSNYCPNSKIKLTLFVKKRPFNILLNYPKSMFLVSMPYEVNNIIQPFKYLNATSLVKSCRFDQPHVLRAVLNWDTFMSTTSIRDFLESLHKIRHVFVVPSAINYVSRRCCVKYRIAALDRILICKIVTLERSYQLSFSCYSCDYFKMVENKWLRVFIKSLINSIVACKSKVSLPPIQIHLLYALILRH